LIFTSNGGDQRLIAVGILTLGGTDLVSLTSPVTPIQCSVLIKSTDTVLMALGRKGLNMRAIKGLTVCCVCVLHCKHTALDGCAMLRNHRPGPGD
ncbi:unnamed protein product, partial [Staurois parvus]